MSYNSTTWTETTKKIYYGVLLYSLVGLVYPFFEAINSLTSGASNVMKLANGLRGRGGSSIGIAGMDINVKQYKLLKYK